MADKPVLLVATSTLDQPRDSLGRQGIGYALELYDGIQNPVLVAQDSGCVWDRINGVEITKTTIEFLKTTDIFPWTGTANSSDFIAYYAIRGMRELRIPYYETNHWEQKCVNYGLTELQYPSFNRIPLGHGFWKNSLRTLQIQARRSREAVSMAMLKANT